MQSKNVPGAFVETVYSKPYNHGWCAKPLTEQVCGYSVEGAINGVATVFRCTLRQHHEEAHRARITDKDGSVMTIVFQQPFGSE